MSQCASTKQKVRDEKREIHRALTIEVEFERFTLIFEVWYQRLLLGSIPGELGNCNFLEYLYTVDNDFSGIIPHEIGNLHNLKIFHVGLNSISGSLPSAILNLSKVELIDLTANSISGHLPSNIGFWLPNLEGLPSSESTYWINP
eukprot:XP_025014921.1 pollen-specific leucine-rich repeat extensin-like protein 4 [Ricinus communis]